MRPSNLYTIFVGITASFTISSSSFADTLADQTAQELANPRTFTSSELASIEGTQFIFADGMFGDHFKANFEPARAVLDNEWNAENEVIWGKSANTMPTNSEILYQDVLALRKSSQKKNAILITHSKGGDEAMLMLLHHPDMVQSLGFTNFVFISAALGGSNIVEFINTFCGNNKSFLCNYLEQVYPSLEDFTSKVVQPMFEEALASATAADRAEIEAKAFYVQTQMPKDDFTSKLFLSHTWMDVSHPEDGPNDGAIPTKNEIMQENGFGPAAGPVFGTGLGIMMGDHNSLMNRAKNDTELQYRQAFFKVLMNRVLLRNLTL